MSLKKVEQVKQDRGFKLFDLIIYGAIIAIVAVLFIVVFTTGDRDPLTGVRVYASGKVVLEYQFGEELTPQDGLEIVKDGDSYTVTVRSGDGDINVIYIDVSQKTVKMIDANCKGKQCVYSGAMHNNSSFIYCSPHSIRIEPLKKDLDNPNIIF